MRCLVGRRWPSKLDVQDEWRKTLHLFQHHGKPWKFRRNLRLQPMDLASSFTILGTLLFELLHQFIVFLVAYICVATNYETLFFCLTLLFELVQRFRQCFWNADICVATNYETWLLIVSLNSPAIHAIMVPRY